MKALLGLVCLPLLCMAAPDERAAIIAERGRLQQRFAAEEAACATRFVVNACVEDVRLRRRQALEPLRERELRLDQAERVKRADDRRAAIEAKRAASPASRPSAAALPQLRLREPVPPPVAASRPTRGPEDDRAAEAAARAREASQRREEAQAAQQRVQQRRVEREAAGKKSEPLPVPPARR